MRVRSRRHPAQRGSGRCRRRRHSAARGRHDAFEFGQCLGTRPAPQRWARKAELPGICSAPVSSASARLLSRVAISCGQLPRRCPHARPAPAPARIAQSTRHSGVRSRDSWHRPARRQPQRLVLLRALRGLQRAFGVACMAYSNPRDDASTRSMVERSARSYSRVAPASHARCALMAPERSAPRQLRTSPARRTAASARGNTSFGASSRTRRARIAVGQAAYSSAYSGSSAIAFEERDRAAQAGFILRVHAKRPLAYSTMLRDSASAPIRCRGARRAGKACVTRPQCILH